MRQICDKLISPFLVRRNHVILQNNFKHDSAMVYGYYKVYCLKCKHKFDDIDAEVDASVISTLKKRCPKCGSKLLVRIPKIKL